MPTDKTTKTTRTTRATTKIDTKTSPAADATAAPAAAPQPAPAPAAATASAEPAPPIVASKKSSGWPTAVAATAAGVLLLALIAGAFLGGFIYYDYKNSQQVAANVAVGEPNTAVVEIGPQTYVVDITTDTHVGPVIVPTTTGNRCVSVIATRATALVMTGSPTGGPAQAAVQEWSLETAGWREQEGAFYATVCLPMQTVAPHGNTGMSLCQDGQRGSCWSFEAGRQMATLVASDIGPRRPVCFGPPSWCSQVVLQH